MKDTINNANDFANRFMEIRKENFSRAALESLFNWYEQLEEDTGEEIEFDPIAICCDWAEYTEEELRQEYSEIVEDCDDLEDMRDALNDHTIVIETRDNTLLVMEV